MKKSELRKLIESELRGVLNEGGIDSPAKVRTIMKAISEIRAKTNTLELLAKDEKFGVVAVRSGEIANLCAAIYKIVYDKQLKVN